ncbi:MAG: hypothetical protein CBC57_01545 [Euryarchaeota archaeon TMED97]|nr:MAG: hypothetical protein CBC57_01545 [Euryarchaeota archaeon TMED97]|tara:strand:+ start:4495 stop:5112 length:618 start_codon:yes stop_codon:yes gene_type:complete
MPVLAENRARLILKRGARSIYFNGNSILSPLVPHHGIMFPIQPDITYSQSVAYTPYDLTHTNYTFQAYRNTPSPDIQMTCQFASVTDEEARYTYAVLHFLRSVSKMWFGANEGNSGVEPGTPPPVLLFSAFGQQQFSNIPVVVTQFSTTYDSNVDLKLIDGNLQVPTMMNMFIGIAIQQNPDRQKNVYSTTDFVSGKLYGEQGFI